LPAAADSIGSYCPSPPLTDRWRNKATSRGRAFATVEEYISAQPDDVQVILRHVRSTIRERISYQIPAMAFRGQDLVYFAAWKRHISVYPLPGADAAFAQELGPYLAGKSTVKFPLGKPILYDLIRRLVALLAEQRHQSPGWPPSVTPLDSGSRRRDPSAGLVGSWPEPVVGARRRWHEETRWHRRHVYAGAFSEFSQPWRAPH
jgi:uncharacterized protein YdhG (YjbR/CyaY superfamily)